MTAAVGRPVLTAAEGAAWEQRLIGELRSVPTGFDVVRRCVDVVDLLASAALGHGVVALVDAQLRRFDAAAADRLLAYGVAVVGVMSAGDAAQSERLRTAGVEFVVPADVTVEVLATVIDAALTAARGESAADRGFGDPAFASGPLQTSPTAVLAGEPVAAPVGEHEHERRAAEPSDDTPAEGLRRGAVVAVWGPTGAPGRTTVAVGLADELSRLDRDALLVDADVYGGVIASVLGLLDESPGMSAACRLAQSRRLDQEALAGLAWQVNPRLRVLTGITRADRWPELRTTAVQAVLTECRGIADYTVIDVGFSLETDEELSFDTLAPRRNGATLAILDEADLVLAVGSADPTGVQRLVRGLADLAEAGVTAPVWVVLNRVRRTAVPGDPEAELAAALTRFAGRSAAAQLPFDLAALDSAALTGKTLAEAAPSSALRRAIVELAAAVAGVSEPRRRRRHRASGGLFGNRR